MVTNLYNSWLPKKVNQTTIIGAALLVSILFNLPRVLSVFDIIKSTEGDTLETPWLDVLVRFVFLFFASWLILQLNANWRYLLKSRSLFIEIVITILVHVVLFYSIIRLFLLVYTWLIGNEPTTSEIGYIYLGYIIVFVLLFFVAKMLHYQVVHKHNLIEKEALKRHSLESELMALKNQVNPHFLFNSLNSLSSLVRDNEDATKFIDELSLMYRYILQSREEDLVSLEQELNFLKNYMYLIKTRYRNRVEIEIAIDTKWLKHTIPVLSLQLLVENAVKHNEISKENPLLIKVYIEDNHIVVENEMRPRKTLVKSTGQGLNNIDKRYLILKRNNIIIDQYENKFKVKLPLN